MRAMELLFTLALVGLIVALTPFWMWLAQGMKAKRGGVTGAFMDGFATVFETQHTRVHDAHAEKPKGSRENGDPPSIG